MTKQVVLWSIIFAIFSVVALALVWVAVGALIESRRNKRLLKIKKAEDNRKDEATERASEAVAKPRTKTDESYVGYLGISKKVDEHIQLIQLKTRAGSPGEVISDALRFYAEIVNMYGPGDQLLFRKSSEEGFVLLRFEPLGRIGKKIES